MKILLAGPMETAALGSSTDIDLSGLPVATTPTPIAPLAGGLLAAGHEVHVLTCDPRIERTEEHRRGPLTLTFCPLRGEPRYRARARARDLFAFEIALLTEAMRASDADIVHAHWTYEYAEAAIRSKLPTVVTMHDLGLDVLLQFRDLYRAMRLAMKYRAMLRVKVLTAVAPFVARKASMYGYRGHVDVVPNPVDPVDWTFKSLCRPVIATIGDSGRLKNVGASVAAFAAIRRILPAAELHLFGPGLGSDGSFGGVAGVVCHGSVPHDRLMKFLSDEARLLIHSSRLETFGVIIAEAKMRGVPVIGGKRSGGVGWVVGDAGGALVDIERPAEIAAAALAILSDPARYTELQHAAHADASARFSTPVVTAKYLKVYERVLARVR